MHTPPALHVGYQNNFGWALQAGFDVPVGNGFFLNFDAKKLFLSTRASVDHGAIVAHTNIDPWLVGAGVGWRF